MYDTYYRTEMSSGTLNPTVPTPYHTLDVSVKQNYFINRKKMSGRLRENQISPSARKITTNLNITIKYVISVDGNFSCQRVLTRHNADKRISPTSITDDNYFHRTEQTTGRQLYEA